MAAALIALIIQGCGGREMLLYDRAATGNGEWWRLWTGHLVHFGWPHFMADMGLFLVLGWLVEQPKPWLARLSLVLMLPAIFDALFWFDPELHRYGGLSAYNLGLLLFYAGHGWRKDWTDWFWPAVLVIYVGELILEITASHGMGGGMIKFDDPTVHVATTAHLAGIVCGLVMLVIDFKMSPRKREGR